MRFEKFVQSVIIVNCFLFGCGIHLYDKSNDQHSQKAQSTFSDAKISEVISEQRLNLVEVKNYEQAVVKRNVVCRRDAALNSFINISSTRAGVDRLKSDVDKRIQEITGADAAASERFIQKTVLLQELRKEMQNLASNYNLVKKTGDPEISCPFKGYSSLERGDVAYADGTNYRRMCLEYLEKTDDLKKWTPGRLGEINHSIFNLDATKSNLKAESDKRFADYSSEKTKYNKLSKQAKPILGSYTSTLNMVSSKLIKFGNISSYATKIPDKYKGYLSQISIKQLQEKIMASENILKSLQSNDPSALTDSGEKTVFIDVELATNLINMSDNISSELRKKNLNAILLVMNNLKYLSDYEKRKLSHAENQYNILVKSRDAYLEELKMLATSRAQLKISENHRRVSDDERKYAFLLYANSWTPGRLTEELLDYESMEDQYDEALDDSEIAMEQWSNMVTIPLKSLADYHASGLKEETIATLLSAIAISATIGAK